MKAHQTILLVEDNSSLAGEIADLLQMMQYNVIVATNGKEGLKMVKEKKPDLVLTDLLMPEMDGLEMITEIRSDRAGKNIPIIILSAKVDPEVDLAAIKLNVKQVIRKPSRAQYLIESVKRVLSENE